jgi:hypothetical protein
MYDHTQRLRIVFEIAAGAMKGLTAQPRTAEVRFLISEPNGLD